jgi:hypothetical protein
VESLATATLLPAYTQLTSWVDTHNE